MWSGYQLKRTGQLAVRKHARHTRVHARVRIAGGHVRHKRTGNGILVDMRDCCVGGAECVEDDEWSVVVHVVDDDVYRGV